MLISQHSDDVYLQPTHLQLATLVKVTLNNALD